ncbi:MAG: S8 family serine peptidase [Bacteroidales bacterium]|nr:S8 family serine peptidase [Bacteroidales bacterium]
MKNATLLIAILSFVFFSLDAQVFDKKNTFKPAKAELVQKLPVNYSPEVAKLIYGPSLLKSTTVSDGEIKLTEKRGQYFVDAFIGFSNDFDPGSLVEMGLEINSLAKNICTARIPLNSLEPVLNLAGISYIEISRKTHSTIDSARNQTLTNQVHEGLNITRPYTGKNVIVGIIDGGFDYTHPTFYDSTFTDYRISRVWDQGTDGTPPTGFNYGNELVGKDEILGQGNDGLNEGSHGTHVAGIAAGSGGSLHEKYRGIAFESEIVIVATKRYTTDIADAITYIFNHADQVGKPAVINISLGSHYGPHDGTSFFDSFTDQYAGGGRIVVGSAGNEGSRELHLDHTFSGTDTVFSFIEFKGNPDNPSAGSTFMDLWGEENSEFTFAVNIFNTESNTYQDFTDYISTSSSNAYNITLNDGDGTDTDRVTLFISVQNSNPNNNKPRVFIEFDNTEQDGNGDIHDYIMLEIIGENLHVDAWSGNDDNAVFSKLDYTVPELLDGNTNSTIGEIGGTGKNIISVGAYTSKTEFTDIEGNTYYFPGIEAGEIAYFSSKGPTADSRIKPDITAPGQWISSSVSSVDPDFTDSYDYVTDGITEGGIEYLFALKQGTSMSSPAVAGIVALLLEANPVLSPDGIKQLFENHSINTANTGDTPNNTWGYGMINAHELVQVVENQSYEVTITVDPESGGTVSGAGTYATGDTARLKATPAVGYEFTGWSEDGSMVHQDTVFIFRVLSNRALIANFKQIRYEITASVDPANSGTVSGPGSYLPGETAEITATPGSNYNFINWTEADTVVTEENTFSFTVNGQRSFVANFDLKSISITAEVNPENSGTITGAGTYTIGEIVELTATPNEGYGFKNWSYDGAVVSQDTAFAFTANADMNLVANFEVQEFEISTTVNPENSGTVTGTGTFQYGATAVLTAIPDTGYKFVNWTENDTEMDTADIYSFDVYSNRTLAANFNRISGIDNYDLDQIWAYPNPVKEILYFNIPDNEYSISLYSFDGRLIYKNTNVMLMDMSDFQEGIYCLKIKTESRMYLEKIIKVD